MVADSLWYGVVHILALHGGLHQAPLHGVGHLGYLGLLETMLLDSVYAGVLQQRHNWMKEKLGISVGLGITLLLGGRLVSIDCGETVGAVGSGHVLALQGVLQLLSWNLDILALILSLRSTLLDLDDLLLGGAVGGVVHQRSAVGHHRKKRISLGIRLSNRHTESNTSKKCKTENLRYKSY